MSPAMPFADDAAIAHLARRMIDRTLPKAEWTHAGHFAAALWLLRHRPDLATPEAMRGLIRAYNEATGTPNTDSSGYHHTITIASLRAAAAHLDAGGEGAPLCGVLDRLMSSPQGRSDWLLAHWSRDRLFDPTARHHWVEPDLAPLPF
ncbi:hypothetical protein [Novosphingobium aerophilum]|uniref:hypothetical protein n=1 Tax=Novosphingobium aerophilum TaxID=2839843 RepID=UPI001FD149F6|nr:hypothetical protein [Novosphingobium aerophilum]